MVKMDVFGSGIAMSSSAGERGLKASGYCLCISIYIYILYMYVIIVLMPDVVGYLEMQFIFCVEKKNVLKKEI